MHAENLTQLVGCLNALDGEIGRRIDTIEASYRTTNPGLRLELIEVCGHLIQWGKVNGEWRFHTYIDGYAVAVNSLARHVRLEFYAWVKDPDRLYHVACTAVAREIEKRREVLGLPAEALLELS